MIFAAISFVAAAIAASMEGNTPVQLAVAYAALGIANAAFALL